MRLPSSRLVQQLQRRVVDGFYGDYAVLIKKVGTGTYDANNMEVVTLLEIPLDCSFTEKAATEDWTNYADVGQVDAEVRFAGYTPTKSDTVRVGDRFDHSSLSSKTYEIVGISNRYTFGYVCALRRVEV
jgi:hypothetical protein